MESSEEPIDDNEKLLRRIPPSSEGFHTIVERKDEGSRATTPSMKTRKDEDHLSCSRLRFTSPHHLLEDLRNDNKYPEGWNICQFLVSDLKEIGLEIMFSPTDRDSGHCSITGEGGLSYPNNKAQKLARRTRILTSKEIVDLSQ